MVTRLKPCPCCGGKAILDREDIFCEDCELNMSIENIYLNNVGMSYDEAVQEAVDRWNERQDGRVIYEID